MSTLREVGNIQVHEDPAFQRVDWRFQRIGWIGMAGFVILGLLGGFGRGILAEAEAGNRAQLAVSYDRIVRHGADAELAVHIGHVPQQDSTVRVAFSRSYLHSFDVMAIIPEPSESGSSDTFVHYDFKRSAPGTPATILFQLRAKGLWNHSATVTVDGVTVKFKQFILP
jgi:hypothetical protein